MKTTGMSQQLEALRRMNGREGYALLMEQGTGKTWTLLADMERLFAAGLIDALFVVAPKGVHTNWVRREIPTHVDVEHIARAWKSGAGKRERAELERALFTARERGEPVRLRILSMNIDALGTKDGYGMALRFLRVNKCLFVIDESSRIKNPTATRTIKIESLRHLAPFRRIATGTPITNAPVDIFSQMEFLESGLLGTTSYRAFVAEYADLEVFDTKDVTHEDYWRNKKLLERNPHLKHAQVVAKNPDGSKRWRNLDKLSRLLSPHSFRVLKKDCLDLPAKIYKQVFFDLDAQQRRAYKLMEDELRIELEDGDVLSVSRLAAIMKLQQITSGFVVRPGSTELIYVTDGNPRLDALMGMLEDAPPGKLIVWARFKEELRAVSEALRKAGRVVVEYHGDVKDKDREAAVDRFQNGDADAFVGQPQSGGIGLTLTAAEWVVYYSNDFNSETRLQSEDRCHRIGTTAHVVYTDLVAEGTIDEAITRALQRKSDLAAEILGNLR